MGKVLDSSYADLVSRRREKMHPAAFLAGGPTAMQLHHLTFHDFFIFIFSPKVAADKPRRAGGTHVLLLS